jgi:hypothetical protein
MTTSSLSASPLASLPESRPSPAPADRPPVAALQRGLTVAYGVAVTCGLLPVFASVQAWPLPLIAMIGYLAYGYRRTAEAGLVFEFADAFYYLGFTLSIGSLLAALEPFNFAGRPDPGRVFHYFGLGMLSTLLGVVVRTMLQSYHRMPDEALEATNREIQEEAQRYLDGLRALTACVESDLTQVAARFEASVHPALDRVAEALEQTARAAQTTERQAAETTTVLATTLQGLGATAQRYTDAAGALVASHAQVGAAATDLSEAVTGAATQVREARVGGELTAIRDAAHGATFALQAVTTKAAAVDLDGLANQVGALVRATAALEGHATALGAPDLTQAAHDLRGALAGAAAAWDERHGADLATASASRKAALATTDAARELQTALHEVVAAATRVLEERLRPVPSPERSDGAFADLSDSHRRPLAGKDLIAAGPLGVSAGSVTRGDRPMHVMGNGVALAQNPVLDTPTPPTGVPEIRA